MARAMSYFSSSDVYAFDMPVCFFIFLKKYNLDTLIFTKEEDDGWEIIKYYLNELLNLCSRTILDANYTSLTKDIAEIIQFTGLGSMLMGHTIDYVGDATNANTCLGELLSVSHQVLKEFIANIVNYDIIDNAKIVSEILEDTIIIEVARDVPNT